MGLFNYESSGVGIPKNAEKKTGAKLFFDIWGRKFWKLFEVNMLYFIFFIPLMSIPIALRIPNTLASEILIITLLFAFATVIGPATAGMTRIMRCFLIEKHCFIVRDFFNGFKSNFKKGSIIGFLDCIAVLSAYASINVYPALAVQLETKLMYVPMVIAFSIVLVFLMMSSYRYNADSVQIRSCNMHDDISFFSCSAYMLYYMLQQLSRNSKICDKSLLYKHRRS